MYASTRSGLSIVEWNPISGIIPPLGETAWEAEFTKYQATPEFALINKNMSLEGYKKIFYAGIYSPADSPFCRFNGGRASLLLHCKRNYPLAKIWHLSDDCSVIRFSGLPGLVYGQQWADQPAIG